MKRAVAWMGILCCMALGLLAGCGGQEEANRGNQPVELTVFAAASLTEALAELGEAYMQAHKDIHIVYNFDSSGTLKTQIRAGADCDIFLSAGQKQMNQLDIAEDGGDNTEGLDFVMQGTRFDILENKVVLAVPQGNPKQIDSYGDLKGLLARGDILLAMGNADVPVGQYTQRILAFLGLKEEELAAAGCITYSSNAKEVATQISEAAVDCGVIYQTDAYAAGLTVVDTATEEMCGRVAYPAAALKGTKHAGEARAFLEYLRSDTASAVFEKAGFTPLG